MATSAVPDTFIYCSVKLKELMKEKNEDKRKYKCELMVKTAKEDIQRLEDDINRRLMEK